MTSSEMDRAAIYIAAGTEDPEPYWQICSQEIERHSWHLVGLTDTIDAVAQMWLAREIERVVVANVAHQAALTAPITVVESELWAPPGVDRPQVRWRWRSSRVL